MTAVKHKAVDKGEMEKRGVILLVQLSHNCSLTDVGRRKSFSGTILFVSVLFSRRNLEKEVFRTRCPKNIQGQTHYEHCLARSSRILMFLTKNIYKLMCREQKEMQSPGIRKLSRMVLTVCCGNSGPSQSLKDKGYN